jgi:organic hydroperoxide reductase OsmC/OhrA
MAVEGLKDRCRVEAIYWMEDGPMSEHKVSVKWARNSTDFGYKNYNRDHVWRFDSGVEVPASAAPAYLGNPQRVDPEAAFVAALSSCHMLTFLALASNKGFVVDSYEDNAVGHLEKNANGKLAITHVELHPNIAYGGAKQPTQADLDWLHDKAHRECFIANSVTTKISVVPAK